MNSNFIKIQLKTLFSFSFILLCMSIFRSYFFIKYLPQNVDFSIDIFKMLFLGLRIDLVIVSYFYLPIFLILIPGYFLKKILITPLKTEKILSFYTKLSAVIIAFFLISDIIFYSYFGCHINSIIFGVIDDDTNALIETAYKNYNLLIFGLTILLILKLIFLCINKVYSLKLTHLKKEYKTHVFFNTFIFLLHITILVFFLRGSFTSLFPLIAYIPEISNNKYINSMTTNGVIAFYGSAANYADNILDKIDVLEKTGYKDNIQKAFTDFLNTENIETDDLLSNITYTTSSDSKLEKQPPHVVVIMVEGFGFPIIKYQSSSFDIMASLKSHFDEDIVFTNCISGGNGTIDSLEPFLLNLIQIPSAIAYGQSKFIKTSFDEAVAKIFKQKGYETTFIYGGELTWRNVGDFMPHQGFDYCYGKGTILNHFSLKENDETVHPWGVFDEFALRFVRDILKKSDKPQFIFLLTTNNHPPYITPKKYQEKPLSISKDLEKHLHGDPELLKERLKNYQYVMDQLGLFLNDIKTSALSEKTVVSITADNNTIEGNMHYDNPINESKKIPFYLYVPKWLHYKCNQINTNIPCSHKDIFATIYNLVLSKAHYTSLGNNLLDPRKDRTYCGFNDYGIINTQDGAFQYEAPQTDIQKICNTQYKASMGIVGYIQNKYKKRSSIEKEIR
ncbi:MAG: hypothetical protein HEEMFOPI_00383 [Holosporales bacterium]